MTTRTYFWRKLFRGRRYTTSKRFLAVVAGAATAVLLLAFLLLRGQQHSHLLDGADMGYDEASPSSITDGDAKYPEKIWEWKDHHFQSQFYQFQRDHNKFYATEEERLKRYAIFKNNLTYIHNHNMQGYSYVLKMNKFGDLTLEEFRQRYLGYKKPDLRTPPREVDTTLESVEDNDIPTHVDWRQRGCVTSVKDQGDCGSCWAFSATGAMEGVYCAKTGKLVNLSQQQLVDCSRFLGNQGCDGGRMEEAFEYVVENGGICSGENYPYMRKDGVCKSSQCTSVATITGYRSVPRRSEKSMKTALALRSPVSVAIQANQAAFQFYYDGIFDAPCGTNLDHGVLLVGYSAETAGQGDYWIMKNSWGAAWGKGGYMLMAMHKGPAGQCGVLLDGSFPVA
uniref:Thiolproteinase SmTP1 n=1 Tax=Sarcocystis muris TaxID=5813 RepID=Q9U520_SARMU|nr:thiolproteinase SmTP1 [Sarcocystis muris]